jgi:16S rRNA U1498 N3-methylase RsmE
LELPSKGETMEYFFVQPEDVQGHELILRNDESKHLTRVLRKSVGDRVFATDGNDTM